MDQQQTEEHKLGYVCVPVGRRVLIKKDGDKNETKGGIVLPDATKLPQITGRIIEISPELQNDDDFQYKGGCVLKKYDKVLFIPNNGIPVDLEEAMKNSGGADLLVVPINDIVAVFKKANDD